MENRMGNLVNNELDSLVAAFNSDDETVIKFFNFGVNFLESFGPNNFIKGQ